MPSGGFATRRIGRVVYNIIVFLSFAAICLSMVMTVGDILVRLAATIAEPFLASRPRWGLYGLVDLTQLAMMCAVPLAIAAGFFAASHIQIDLVLVRMSRRMRQASAALSALMGIGLMGLCCWTAWNEMRGQLDFTTTSATLGIEFTWFWAPLILGFALSVVACLVSLWIIVAQGFDSTAIIDDD